MPSTIFFGLQALLTQLEGSIVTREKIEIAKAFSAAHFGAEYFNYDGWISLLNKHNGKLPIKIKAVKEGTEVPVGNALMVIENTDPEFYWLTNYLETYLMRIWYPITIATNSFYCRKTIKKYLDETSDNPDHLAFALHDFGFRGVSSYETAAIGGMAHLTSFMGTDTLAAITAANEFYNDSDIFKMYGFSVSASEHSTATPWGLTIDGEINYIENMLNRYPTGIVSLVADSKDTFRFARILGTTFRERILGRGDGRVVIRPDSGDPVEVNIELIKILDELFGTTLNSKGYKVLPTQIRIIQGDGIDRDMIESILSAFKKLGFAADNIVFGSGGGLLQKFDRDTQRFAIKCSYALINGEEVNVQKDPKTANGTKKSKAGKLKLIKVHDLYVTVSSVDYDKEPNVFEAFTDCLVPVFENGEILVKYDFDEIRNTVTAQL
jgi:nicotinamide phosphoribosyltransferase